MQNRVLRYASSWWAFAACCLALCISYLCFCSGDDAYAKWSSFLLNSSLGVMLYLCLSVNLFFITLRTLFERFGKNRAGVDEIRSMDTFIELSSSGENDLETISEWFRAKGFRSDIRNSRITATKNSLSIIPGTVLRLGLVIFMISLLVSANVRKTDERILHKNSSPVLMGKEHELRSIGPKMPDEFLQVGEESIFRLDHIEAEIRAKGNAFIVSSGYPVRHEGVYYRITNIGFAQQATIKIAQGELSGNLDLNILPPGKTDTVATGFEGISFVVALAPEKSSQKGLLTGSLYNLKIPKYKIAVQKDKKKISEFLLRPDEAFTSGNMAINLGGHALFAKVTAVSDPALPWLYAGFVLIISGSGLMLSRFFWYEKKVCALLADRKILIGYSEEFFKKWGIMKFHNHREDIEALLQA